jgi:hypothetical protein
MTYMRTGALALMIAGMIGGSAAAQQLPGTPSQPSNIPDAQSACAKNAYGPGPTYGYLPAPGGRDISRDRAMALDSNRDGYVSQSEYDAQCAENTFQRLERSNIGGG